MVKQDCSPWEMVASRVGLGAGLLHIRNQMNCTLVLAHHNTILRAFAFAHRSLSEWREGIATSEEKHLEYYMGLRSSINMALQET